MAGNTFGRIFKLTTFGESHGPAIGGIIDGCPAGVPVNLEDIQKELDRRKPGQSNISTQRKESDTVELLSGVFEGRSLGTPIGFIIRNEDAKSKDYSHIKDTYRPGHADWTYEAKYGVRDYRGGGRSSARETACRVVAGAIAKGILSKKGIEVRSYVSQVGNIKLEGEPRYFEPKLIDNNIVRCPDQDIAAQMEEHIKAIRKQGDTTGGVITGYIKGMQPGLGEPVFDKLNAQLAKAMCSINAVKGFEFGNGFESVGLLGSENNDQFVQGKSGRTKTNRSGGIVGGISNGMDIYFKVAFKPVSTIMQSQDSIDREGNQVELVGKGRHDPCVVPRAVPIVDAMAAIVILDNLMLQRSSQF